MSLENPVSHLKIHGFGAFQQCAADFLYSSEVAIVSKEYPNKEGELAFLKHARLMHTLFDMKYLHDAQLPTEVLIEKEAWELLREDILKWIEKFTEMLQKQDQYNNRKDLTEKGRLLMKQWGIISSSFKVKLESLPVEEADIRRMVSELRVRMDQNFIVVGQGGFEPPTAGL
jgi:hypothetical protein